MADLIPTGSEAEWLAARRKGITASEIAVLMGLSPYSSPYALYHQKLGILPPDDDKAVFERGRVLEPYIAEKWAAAHPELMIVGTGRELFASDERPWQMATPDRLLCDDMRLDFDGERVIEEFEPAAVLETKTDAGDEWGDEGTDDIPVHYRCQVLWQMDVMGVAKAHVACLRMRQWDIREYVIGHHPSHVDRLAVATPDYEHDCDICKDIVVMRDAARDFLDRIDRQEAPDVDWRPATAYALKQLHPSVEEIDVEVRRMPIIQYRAAVKAFKAAERRKKEAENRLRLLLGSGHRIVSAHTGEVIARRDVYTVREHVRKASVTDKLVPVYPKEKKHEHADSE